MVTSALGGSSIGVITNFIPCKVTWVKNAWRAAIKVIYLMIPSVIELCITWDKLNLRETVTFKAIIICIIAICFQTVWGYGLLKSSEHIIQSQAYVFNNIHGVYIVMIFHDKCLLRNKTF